MRSSPRVVNTNTNIRVMFQPPLSPDLEYLNAGIKTTLEYKDLVRLKSFVSPCYIFYLIRRNDCLILQLFKQDVLMYIFNFLGTLVGFNM